MDLWQWTGFALAAAVLCMLLRTWHKEMAGVCSVAAGCILLVAALEEVGEITLQLKRIISLAGLKEEYFQTMLKTLGISFLTEFASQLCADLGEQGLAEKVALGGRLMVFTMAVPLMMQLLEIIFSLVP